MDALLALLIALVGLSASCEAFAPAFAGSRLSHHASALSAVAADGDIQEIDVLSRRNALLAIALSGATTATAAAALGLPLPSAAEADPAAEIQVVASGDAKKLFNEGRALEAQGNLLAAQRLYAKVTKISPRFVFGWSNLGNTQVALGSLDEADVSYTTSVDLCREKNKETEQFGARRCDDLYLLLLNRGSLRLNNGDPKGALKDLNEADTLRARPDPLILQNRARARELNGLYSAADKDYSVAISMTSNEVAPFWLRAALVKFQLGEAKDSFNLLKRVENKFPAAPEVRAAYATMLASQGDMVAAQQKLLEIPDKARLRFSDKSYLQNVVSWPPSMLDELAKVTAAVGDDKRVSAVTASAL
mmetsp:Transcript_13501/g.29332  ORF Transcript_13501/g.29332 Transcript_13501/m.29332 type:complete len:362 (-) Transcript_13501:140-1225(-)